MIQKLLIGVIRVYQAAEMHFSGFFFRSYCRFSPSCSEYGVDAIRKHGAARGLYKTVFRVLRCNALFPGGINEA